MSLRKINKEIDKLMKPFAFNKKEAKSNIKFMLSVAYGNINSQNLRIINLENELAKKDKKIEELKSKYDYVSNTLITLLERRDSQIIKLKDKVAQLKLKYNK